MTKVQKTALGSACEGVFFLLLKKRVDGDVSLRMLPDFESDG